MGRRSTNKAASGNSTWRLFGFMILSLLISCEAKLPTEKVEAAFEVRARDNGNKGNASDIEIRYHQYGLDQISHYQVFILKAEKASSHNLEYLQGLNSSSSMIAGPNDVIPSKGKRLPDQMLDSDGDEIIENRAYIAAVISFPSNPETHLPCIAYSEEELVLESNHLISNFSTDFETGAGSLGVDKDGNVLMASYHVLNDLSDSDFSVSNYVMMDSKGESSFSDQDYSYLGGVAIDEEGNFYISNTVNGDILRISSTGTVEAVTHQGADILHPDGIYIDEEQNIFVADRRGSVFKITPEGVSSFVANVGAGLRGITGDENGNLYVSINTEEGKIIVIYPNGETWPVATIPTYVPPDYLVPFKMWLGYLTYRDGLLYVAGTSTDRIYTVSLNGEVTVFAGSGFRQIPFGDILTADFNRPMGLAFSHDGKTLYVSGCEDTVPQHTQASTPSRVYRIDLAE